MANRPVAISAWALAGGIAALVLGTALALAVQAKGGALRPADWAALRFTLTQAALSTLLSCLLAMPVARALARARFPQGSNDLGLVAVYRRRAPHINCPCLGSGAAAGIPPPALRCGCVSGAP